jgi:uncharacterized protein (TIGR03435 family)
MTPAFLSTTIARELSNHLWQSTLFAFVAALLALALRRYPARARYWLWLSASAKFLIPFSLLIAIGAHIPRPTHSTPTQTTAYVTIDEFSQPFTDSPTLTPPIPTNPAPAPTHHYLTLPNLLAALWLIGFLTILTRWLVQLRRIAKSIRNATPLRTGRVPETLRRIERLAHLKNPIPILSSPKSMEPASMEPGVFGVLRPVLLWPEAISPHLDDAHLEAILAHEAAHVRRRDNLTALLPMLVEAIFWFHPLVWGMESQLVKERERACDEEVLLLCHHPQAYAESILKVCELCIESPLTCVSGITGADLKRRIVQIMTAPIARKLTLGAKLLLLTAASLAIAMPILLGHATAAQRMMLAAIKVAPKPVQIAAQAMIAEVQPPSTVETATPQPASAPADNAAAAPDDDALGPEFEVATIRPANRNDGRRWFGMRVDPSGGWSGSAVALGLLVRWAYIDGPGKGNVTTDRDAPKWISSDSFDINAKVDDAHMAGWDKMSEAQRMERVKPMIRRLLADRFHLKLRVEMRDTPVYALVQAKGGAHVKEVSAPEPVEGDPMEAHAKWMADNPGKPVPGSIMCTGSTCTGNAVRIIDSIGQITASSRADRIVVDETGLKGYYDISFTQPGRDDDSAMAEIEDDLGMKFVPRTVPMKTYVIVSAEKPSVDGAELPNPPTPPLTPVSFAQTNPAGDSNTSSLPLMTFEVATIRKSPPDGNFMSMPQGTPANFSARMCTVESMIGFAYNIPYSQVMSDNPKYLFNPHSPNLLGGPDWVSTDKYDLTAKADEATIQAWDKLPPGEQKEELRHMLQTLLTDRFKLTMRHETREMPVWALEVAKGGPKLTPAPGPPPVLNDGSDPSKPYESPWKMDLGLLSGRARTMDELAQVLWGKREIESRKVLDRTGLTGRYNFTLKWAPEDDPGDGSGPSLFTAIQEQLGLKLESTKTPLDVLVIDHIDRPSEN